jgi:acetyl esterase/lipase
MRGTVSMNKNISALVLPWALLCAACAVNAAPAPGDFHLTRIEPQVLAGEISLYEGAASSAPATVIERWGLLNGQRIVRNVTRPTVIPVLPDAGRETGAAVIVAPGGAFMSLSMDSEGFAVAKRLAERGISAFVLKYRLDETPDDEQAFMAAIGARFGAAMQNPDKPPAPSPIEPKAAEDALQALRVVRDGATQWHIDPSRVGIIGFSAGAMTALHAAFATSTAGRPDFVGYIYGPMRSLDVPADAPPVFVAFALDDGLFGRSGFGLVEAWHRAGRPVELHAYERGDHGFGLGKPGTTSTLMLQEFIAWLESRGVLQPPQ